MSDKLLSKNRILNIESKLGGICECCGKEIPYTVPSIQIPNGTGCILDVCEDCVYYMRRKLEAHRLTIQREKLVVIAKNLGIEDSERLDFGHWDCEDSSQDRCVYLDGDEDNCVFCHQPYERK